MKKITINGVELELTQEQVESLKKTLEEKDDGRWEPKGGEEYFYVSTDSGVCSTEYSKRNEGDCANFKYGNMFKTKHEAEMHKLRLQSMAERKWVEGTYYMWHSTQNGTINEYNDNYYADNANFYIGNMHSTSEEAEAWGKKYAEAWKILLLNNKNK
jgi:hypothetical protein